MESSGKIIGLLEKNVTTKVPSSDLCRGKNMVEEPANFNTYMTRKAQDKNLLI